MIFYTNFWIRGVVKLGVKKIKHLIILDGGSTCYKGLIPYQRLTGNWLKLDMRKVYDQIEWPYLRAIILRLGFHRIWVEMIMKLVTSVSFLFQLNGDCLELFTPTRGIRQDDPISPYLFLLAAEGILCLLKSRNQSLKLNGIRVGPSAPMVLCRW